MNRICTVNGRPASLSSVVSQFLSEPVFDTLPITARRAPALMALDIVEGPSHVTVRASLPGVSKETVEIELADGVLSIAAEIPETPLIEGEQALQRERRFGRVARSVSLPADVVEQGGEAQLQDGVLTLRLRKAEKPGPTKIRIQ